MHIGLAGAEKTKPFLLVHQCQVLQFWCQHSSVREAATKINVVLSIKIPQRPSIKLKCLQFSPLSTDIPLLYLPSHSPQHLKEITFSFQQNQRQGRDINKGGEYAQFCAVCAPESELTNPEYGCSFILWNSSMINISKKIIIKLNSGKVERLSAEPGEGLGVEGGTH